jgi:ribokinase
MASKKITVIGSTNTDMVIKTTKLPVPGETILGGEFIMNHGGKGANQAVAAARLGGTVTFIGKTGNDIFGEQSAISFGSEKINTQYIFTDPDHPSGVALITVDENGENCIVVAPGSNATLSGTDIAQALEEILSSDIILTQLEIPMETVDCVAGICHDSGKTLILNPAPANFLSDDLLKMISVLTPNENEAEKLTGVKVTDAGTAKTAAGILRDKGIGIVIITMGSQGAFICSGKMTRMVPSLKVKALDTTAAGDIFNGALAVALSEGSDVEEAVRFACTAAAVSVTRMGARSSAPFRNEVDRLMKNKTL